MFTRQITKIKVLLTLVTTMCVFCVAFFSIAYAEKVSLRIIAGHQADWPAEISNMALNRLIKNHPEIDLSVEVERFPYGALRQVFLSRVAAGDVPDVATIDPIWVADFAKVGGLADITEEVKRWGQLDDFIDAYVEEEGCLYNGRLVSLPYAGDTRLFYWNKNLFAKAGLDPDQPPQTWNGMVAIAKLLNNPPDINGVAIQGCMDENTAFHWYTLVWQQGGEIIAEKNGGYAPAFNSPEGVKALQAYVDLVHKHGITPRQVITQAPPDLEREFFSGHYAMALFGSWSLSTGKGMGMSNDELRDKFGAAFVPLITRNSEFTSGCGSFNYAVMEKAKHPDLAWELVSILSSRDIQRQFAKFAFQLPVRKSLLAEKQEFVKAIPFFEVFAEILPHAHMQPCMAGYPEVSELIQTAIQKALLQKASPKEALVEASRRAKEILAE